MLTFYELDLGLNHVVRKYSEQLEEHANFLITGNISSGSKDLALGIQYDMLIVYHGLETSCDQDQ